jgi:hypothetical protein
MCNHHGVHVYQPRIWTHHVSQRTPTGYYFVTNDDILLARRCLPTIIDPSTMGGGTDPILENNTQSQSQFKSASPSDISTAIPNNSSKPPSPPFPHSSSVPPLAPLEYLQNQRRGSITDPSLHAASSNTHTNPATTNHHNAPHPASPYVFADAATRNKDNQILQNRKVLHSPSHDGAQERDVIRSMSNPRDHAGLGSKSISLKKRTIYQSHIISSRIENN